MADIFFISNLIIIIALGVWYLCWYIHTLQEQLKCCKKDLVVMEYTVEYYKNIEYCDINKPLIALSLNKDNLEENYKRELVLPFIQTEEQSTCTKDT